METSAPKKRKYTFRKGQVVPYESGSVMHYMAKALDVSSSSKKKKRSLF